MTRLLRIRVKIRVNRRDFNLKRRWYDFCN